MVICAKALDPADKSVCLAALQCENSVSKQLSLSLPPVICEPGVVSSFQQNVPNISC